MTGFVLNNLKKYNIYKENGNFNYVYDTFI